MLSLLFVLVFNASADTPVVLPPMEASAEKALPVDTTQPNYPCDQVAQRLNDYISLASQHNLSVANFLNEVTGKLSLWYGDLSPLEGTAQTLPVGIFAPIQDGSDKISQVADRAWENSSLLANEMDRIKSSLAQCVLTAK